LQVVNARRILSVVWTRTRLRLFGRGYGDDEKGVGVANNVNEGITETVKTLNLTVEYTFQLEAYI